MEIINLYKEFKLKRQFFGTGKLYCYNDKKTRPAMLIFPGGGYQCVSHGEWEPIAAEYAKLGYNTFVLEYSVRHKFGFPKQLIEAAMAVAYLKENQEKYHIDGHIAVCGFSAGGHLAASIGTMYDFEEVKVALGARAVNCRPDAMILSYAVISNDEDITTTFKRVSHGDTALAERLSAEKRVTKDTPPAFIWHTIADATVPYKNAVVMKDALDACGVACELKLYEDGLHGLGLAKGMPAEEWIKKSDEFLKSVFA